MSCLLWTITICHWISLLPFAWGMKGTFTLFSPPFTERDCYKFSKNAHSTQCRRRWAEPELTRQMGDAAVLWFTCWREANRFTDLSFPLTLLINVFMTGCERRQAWWWSVSVTAERQNVPPSHQYVYIIMMAVHTQPPIVCCFLWFIRQCLLSRCLKIYCKVFNFSIINYIQLEIQHFIHVMHHIYITAKF